MNSFDACPSFDPIPPEPPGPEPPEPSGPTSQPLWEFLGTKSNWILWGSILMISGLVVAMLGRKILGVTIFIVTVIGTGLFMAMIFFKVFLEKEHERFIDWVVLGCCALFGCVMGAFLCKTEQLGLFVLGASTGFIIGLIITEAFDVSNQAAFWCTCVSLAIIIGIVSIKASDAIMISTSAATGSYLIVRGLSVLIGGYPNEFTLA